LAQLRATLGGENFLKKEFEMRLAFAIFGLRKQNLNKGAIRR